MSPLIPTHFTLCRLCRDFRHVVIYFKVEFQAPALNILHGVQNNISFNVKHNTVHILLLHGFKIFVLNNRKYLYSLSVSFE